MRTPTKEERAQEAAVLYTDLADLGITTLQIIFALATNSLTLLGEAIRGWLMLAVEFYTLFVLRAVHRGRLHKFRFGIGKIEQMCNLVIGVALVFSGLWIADQVVGSLIEDQVAPSPLGLTIAAVICAINTLVNALGWLAMVTTVGKRDSAIFTAQLRARSVKLVSSLVVQATITIAALAKDPLLARALDGIGASFVAYVMISVGLKMVGGCALDVLDRRAPKSLLRQVETALNTVGVTSEEVAHIRSRRSGSIPQIEITLTPMVGATLDDFSRRTAAVEAAMARHIRESDISVVLNVAES